METALYIAEGIFLAAAIAFGVIFARCRDRGYLLLSGLALITAGLAYGLTSWWPIFLGGLVIGLLFVAGSGGIKGVMGNGGE